MNKLPDPIDDAPDPEVAIRPLLVAHATAVLTALLPFVETQPVRALGLIRQFSSVQSELLAELGSNDYSPRGRLGHGLGVALGGNEPYGLQGANATLRAQRILALTGALRTAREEGLDDVAVSVRRELDEVLGTVRGPLGELDVQPAGQVDADFEEE